MANDTTSAANDGEAENAGEAVRSPLATVGRASGGVGELAMRHIQWCLRGCRRWRVAVAALSRAEVGAGVGASTHGWAEVAAGEGGYRAGEAT